MESILDLREKRDSLEKSLLEKYNRTLVTIRPNFPGPEKRNPYANLVSNVLHEEISGRLHVFETWQSTTPEGLIFHLMVEEDGRTAKRICMEVETKHPLGRLADIDVRDRETMFSRIDFNEEPRKCYLCDDDAILCVRSMRHSPEEVASHFMSIVKDYIQKIESEDENS